MFLHLSAILFTGRGVSQHAMGRGVFAQEGVCGRHHPTEAATEVGGTHPTGMYSCFVFVLSAKISYETDIFREKSETILTSKAGLLPEMTA